MTFFLVRSQSEKNMIHLWKKTPLKTFFSQIAQTFSLKTWVVDGKVLWTTLDHILIIKQRLIMLSEFQTPINNFCNPLFFSAHVAKYEDKFF